MKAVSINSNGNFIDTISNKVLFFSMQNFLDEIVNKNNCFICGIEDDGSNFNDEHIIPKWILRRFDLFDHEITLPNGHKKKYSKYKIPCCSKCNSHLGTEIESPISKYLNCCYGDLIKKMTPEKAKLIYKWVSLIFIKIHLKDKFHNIVLDQRISKEKISKAYDWGYFHHIHAIARSTYTEAIIDDKVFGTLFVYPVTKDKNSSGFDYVDSPTARTLMIQLENFAIIAVLDDSNFCTTVYNDILSKITGSLNSIQLRQVLSNLNAINLCIKDRPEFQSIINNNTQYQITAKVPENFSLFDKDKMIATPGDFLYFYLKNLVGLNYSEDDYKNIKESKVDFLFDEDGKFIDYSKK
jgi:hypothetical protein